MRLTIISFILSCIIAIAVAACGIKPEFVDPPQGTEQDQFPRTYPAPDNNG